MVAFIITIIQTVLVTFVHAISDIVSPVTHRPDFKFFLNVGISIFDEHNVYTLL
jgi:hypothetical protein